MIKTISKMTNEFFKSRNHILFTFLIINMGLINAQPTFTVFDQANTPQFTTAFFRGIAVGKYGHVWAGSQSQGLYRYNGIKWEKASILQTHSIRAISMAPDSSIWVAQSGTGSSGGSTNINGGVNRIADTSYTSQYWGYLTGLPTRACYGVAISGSGDVFTSHFSQTTSSLPNGEIRGGGLGYKNPAASNFSAIYSGMPYNGALYNGTINVPYVDQFTMGIGTDNQEVWIGLGRSCDNGNCIEPRIARYTMSGTYLGSITSSDAPFPFTNLNTTPVVRAIFFDSQGRAWIGLSAGAGIVVRDQGKWKVINETNSAFVKGSAINFHAISEDKRGNLYFGTDAGLLVIEKGNYSDSLSYKLYNTSNGLPAANVLSIAKGKDAMWLSTGAGIVKMQDAPRTDISGTVYNTSMDFSAADLHQEEFPGVKVVLYENAVASDSLLTDAKGAFSFDSLKTGSTYHLKLSFDGAVKISCDIEKAKLNEPYTVKLPYDLYGQLQNELASLSSENISQEWFNGWIDFSPLKVDAYDTTQLSKLARNLLKFKLDDKPEVNEAMARIWCISKGLDELSRCGVGMISMTTKSLTDVGEILFVNSSFAKKLEKIFATSTLPYTKPIANRIALINDRVYKSIRTYLTKSLYGIKDANLRINKRARLLGATDALYAAAGEQVSEKVLSSPYDFAKKRVQEVLINVLSIPVFQQAYIGLSQPNITDASSAIRNSVVWSTSLNQNMNTNIAANNSSKLATAKKNYVSDSSQIETLNSLSDLTDNAASLFKVASAVSTITGFGAPLVPFFQSASKIMEVLSFTSKVGSIYTGMTGGYSVYATTFPLTTSILARKETPDEFTPEPQVQSLAMTNYINLLKEIRTHVVKGERNEVATKSDLLIDADEKVFNEMSKLSDLVSLYSNGSIGANPDWIDFMNNRYLVVNSTDLIKREGLNFNLIAYLIDENNQYGTGNILASIDDVLAHANITEKLHDSLSTASQTWSITSGLLINSQHPYQISAGTNIPVKVSITNPGNAAVNDVYIKLSSLGGLTFSSDSIFVGTINPGATINLAVDGSSPSKDTLVTYAVEGYGKNVLGDGTGGAILVKKDIPTQINQQDNATETFSVFPNPTNGRLMFHFKDDVSRNVLIVDATGREVMNTQLKGKNPELFMDVLPDGVYMIRINDKNNMFIQRIVKQ